MPLMPFTGPRLHVSPRLPESSICHRVTDTFPDALQR
eukprot:COSAG02_NODE_21159_length_799_cov_3.202857_1_plen_36_part_10